MTSAAAADLVFVSDLLTTADAARRLGLSEVRVRRFCREGRLGRRVGDRWLITADELEVFCRRARRSGRPRGSRKGSMTRGGDRNARENV